MKLFRKKNEKKSCCGEGNRTPEVMHTVTKKKTENGIKVLGVGCAKCVALEKSAKMAVRELGLDFDVEHIADFAEIASYGVMSTPALVINGKVVSYGKVLSAEEVKIIIEGGMKNEK